MATGDRSQKIRIKIQTSLKDPEGIGLAHSGNVYDSINRIQDRICEETGGDETKETVSVVANTELYSLPSGFYAERAIVQTSTTLLKRLNLDEVVEVKRLGTDVTTTTTDPIYYYFWNDQVGFMTSAGQAPTSTMTVTLYGWKNRKADGTEDASDSIDPIVHTRWDTCLWYGACADISGSPDWIARYELEFQRVRLREAGYHQASYQIPQNRDYD